MTLPPPPLPVALRPAGTTVAAGMALATVVPDHDFETYSEAGFEWDEERQRWVRPYGAPKTGKPGLFLVGAENYTAHPTCEVLCYSYDMKDGRGKRFWRPGLPPPTDLFAYLAGGGVIEAWNTAFERWVWVNVCVPRYGWPPVPEGQWRCAMAKSRAHALPGGLKKAGEVLGLDTQKDGDGQRLLDKFSKPRNPTKGDPRRRVLPLWTQEDIDAEWARSWRPGMTPGQERKLRERILDDHKDTLALGQYNLTDIAAEAEASARSPDLTGDELAWWQADLAINSRGCQIDVQGVRNCIAVIEQAHARYNAELFALTGIEAASMVEQLLGWLHARGVHLDSLDEENVQAALGWSLPPEARRVLEIRAAIGSASVKKVFAMLLRASAAGRLHDMYVFHGARTGRPTGEGPQPTNLPKAGPDVIRCVCGRHHCAGHKVCPWCGFPVAPGAKPGEWNPQAAEDALVAIATLSLDWVEHVFGEAMLAIAGVLRALFIAAPGHDLISTDLNSIEAVGLAKLAGEKWRIAVFRSHGKIYETSASMMYGVPLEEILGHKKATGQHHPLRQKGKIGELAFGYQGWVGAAQAFDMPGTEDEIKSDILAWRRASPTIEWLWGGQTKGKAAGIVRNALLPTYDGDVADEHRLRARDDKWDDTTYYFGCEGAFIQAALAPNVEFPVTRLDGTDVGIVCVGKGDAVYVRLPSGRYLSYHRVRLEPATGGRTGMAISYEGWNSNPKNGPIGWIRMRTWGGRLVENYNQAICRDVFRHGCLNLERGGYPIVLHTYDESVSEVPEGFGSLEEYERLLTEPPPWASDWPIRAPDGWRAKRYRKG